ncbi:MAG: Slx4p interacting protein [Sporothrix thermara]
MASTVSSRPIPALYTVYILRSTMRHASLYIGSTPDPPRRLKQHNGAIKGGAARTARASLRPWEMVGLVSGFPGPVAALKFEWALTNPHLSLHIPAESRLSVARQTKRNGHPRRPPASLQSILANLHLLLRVPSFARWPLRLHIFVPEVHAAWNKWAASQAAGEAGDALSLDEPLEVLTDFRPSAADSLFHTDDDPRGPCGEQELGPAWGIHALPLDYGLMRDYVDKAQDIFTFEREGDCTVCHTALPAGQGLYVVCPNTGCEAVGHLRCWSGHLLAGEAAAAKSTTKDDGMHRHLVPKRGHCPECGGPVVWGDMMKELTLRMRAPKEVEKLVRAKRWQEKAAEKAAADAEKAAKKAAKKTASKAAADTVDAVGVAAEEPSSSIEIVSSTATKAAKTATTKTPRTRTAAKTVAKTVAKTPTKTTTQTKRKAKTKEAEPASMTTTAVKAARATKITRTARVTKAASATLPKTTQTASATTASAATTKSVKAAKGSTSTAGDASAVLLDRAESPEVIVL